LGTSEDATVEKVMPKISHAIISITLLTFVYLGALIWLDSGHQVFANVPRLLGLLPVLAGFSLFTFLVRYARWFWLLRRAECRVPPLRGLLAYLAGFAFTATPGKVGELVRIRYFLPMKVPAWRVVSAFIFERTFDLLAVLALASLMFVRQKVYVTALMFVFVFLASLILTALNLNRLALFGHWLRSHDLRRVASGLETLLHGLRACKIWFTPLDLAICLSAGLMAWSLTAFSFVWLLKQLGVILPFFPAFAAYPVAILAGAASMLPGGVGTTEVTLALLLTSYGVSLSLASLAAIGIRLASLWFAILVGLSSLCLLESRQLQLRM
jgi:uncharacterized protein (TIRG00374 family)